MPYSFFVNDEEIVDNLRATLEALKSARNKEDVVAIVYHPQAIFRVRCVTQCTASLPGNMTTNSCFSRRYNLTSDYSRAHGGHIDM